MSKRTCVWIIPCFMLVAGAMMITPTADAAYDNFDPLPAGGGWSDLLLGSGINNRNAGGGASGGVAWAFNNDDPPRSEWYRSSDDAPRLTDISIGSQGGLVSDGYAIVGEQNRSFARRSIVPEDGDPVYFYLLARADGVDDAYNTNQAFFSITMKDDLGSRIGRFTHNWQTDDLLFRTETDNSNPGINLTPGHTYLFMMKISPAAETDNISFFVDPDLTQPEGTADWTATTAISAGGLERIELASGANPSNYWSFDNVTVTQESPFASDAMLAGDANGDGQVDGNDLISVEENFGATGDPGIAGDANGDGQVDGNDLISVEENFGATSGAASVPEPASLLLLGLCGATLLRTRR